MHYESNKMSSKPIVECKPINLTNGHIIGNLNAVGSRIAYVCDEGYTPTSDMTFSVCQPDGNWEGELECEPGCVFVLLVICTHMI